MTKCLQSKLIFMVCLSAMFGLMFSGGAHAQITVSDPVIDATTGGNFEDTYGECFFLLPNPNIDRCEEEVGPVSYWSDSTVYTSPSDRDGCFDKNDPNFPKSDHGGAANVCFGNPTAPLNSLPVAFEDFSVDDFRVYRVDNAPDQAVTGVAAPDIAFAWSTIAGPNGGQYASIPCPKTLPPATERYATFDSEFVEDTAVTETVINHAGSIALAYYFVNAADVCRVLMFELYVNGVLEKSGTIGDFQSGKYLVFEKVAGLNGATTIRLETALISDPDGTPTICGDSAPIPGVNAHISGVFIDDCEPPPSLCSIGDYVWEDADRDGCQGLDEPPLEGVEVKLFEDCGDPAEIASTTTNADGFYEFSGLDCNQEYRVQFGDAGDIYTYTEADQECSTTDPPRPSDTKDSDCSQNGGFSGCVTFPDPVNAPDNPTIDCGYINIECQIKLTPPRAENQKPGDHTVTAEIICPEDISPAGIEVDFSIVSGPHAGADGTCSPNVDCTTDAGGQVSFTYLGTDEGTDDIQACFTDLAGLNKCDGAVKIWEWPPDECPDYCERTIEDRELTLEWDKVEGNNYIDCTGCDYCFKLNRATLVMDCFECIGAEIGIIMVNNSELRGGTVRDGGVGIKVEGNNNSVIVMRSYKNRRDGIQIAGKYNKIKDSVFAKNGAAGIEVDGANNRIFGNEAFGNAEGIKIENGARANKLYNNAVDENKGPGIHLQRAANNVVRNNYIEGNQAAGIWTEITAIGNKIKNNYSMDNNLDMKDAHPTCSQNTWQSNYFGTSDPNCIR